MINLIFYNMNKVLIPLIIFFIIIIILGTLIFYMLKQFDVRNKTTIYLGIFSNLNTKQILSLATVIIRTYLIIVASIINPNDILIYLIMIGIVDIVFIILNYRKAIFEIISIFAQICLLYLIKVLSMYQIEVNNEMYVFQVKIFLIVFIIMYTMYFLIKNIEDIISDKKGGKIYEAKQS